MGPVFSNKKVIAMISLNLKNNCESSQNLMGVVISLIFKMRNKLEDFFNVQALE